MATRCHNENVEYDFEYNMAVDEKSPNTSAGIRKPAEISMSMRGPAKDSRIIHSDYCQSAPCK
eukprot:scaffold318113_cov31-Prasinocladus_malaysianus.AAC.1